jgi:hypothetical protein
MPPARLLAMATVCLACLCGTAGAQTSTPGHALPAASANPGTPANQDTPASQAAPANQDTPASPAGSTNPDAPASQAAAPSPTASPCEVKRASVGLAWDGAQGAAEAAPNPAAAAAAAIGNPVDGKQPEAPADLVPCTGPIPILSSLASLKKLPFVDWYARFLSGPQVKPMTPAEKGWLAVRNLIDPFNAVTILASSGIAVASNSHSAYGPGMRGFGRYVGVSYAQDATGEFFGTFLIPSIAHQDPHYHRMPDASIKRRIAHCLYQVGWTQGDNGKGMVNYADLVGYGIDDEIGNLYIPGRQTNGAATAERYATALATAPVDNFITEFLPDIAERLHVRVVLIQQIINHVANRDGGSSQ